MGGLKMEGIVKRGDLKLQVPLYAHNMHVPVVTWYMLPGLHY